VVYNTKNIKLINKRTGILAVLLLFILLITSCNKYETVTKEVTATAYNSLAHQTHAEHPEITAWGDSLKPGMKSIAVSRDLMKQGLTYNKKVKIEGLPGVYTVMDKMHFRWKNRIDIYMGKNEELAKEWGRQKVTISWKVKKEKYKD
jgi:3D (Asp-Asp-Asp) domain-containing protein